MQLITGELSGIRTREAGPLGNQWTETQLVVVDWGSTYYVKASKELVENPPAVGTKVALEVSVNTYVSKAELARAVAADTTPKGGHELYAHRRNLDVERSLFGAALKSASA